MFRFGTQHFDVGLAEQTKSTAGLVLAWNHSEITLAVWGLAGLAHNIRKCLTASELGAGISRLKPILQSKRAYCVKQFSFWLVPEQNH